MIVFALAILIIVVGVLTIILNLKPKGKSVDYYALFIMGIIWTAAGLIVRNFYFSGLGLVFIIISFANKDKWEENRKHWNKLNKDEKRLVLGMIIILGLLVLAGVVALLLIKNGTI